jgi:hypothetical protein
MAKHENSPGGNSHALMLVIVLRTTSYPNRNYLVADSNSLDLVPR